MIFNSVFDFCIFVYTIALMRRILLQLYVQKCETMYEWRYMIT